MIVIVCASTLFKFRRNPRSTSLCRKSANIDSQFCRRAGGLATRGYFFSSSKEHEKEDKRDEGDCEEQERECRRTSRQSATDKPSFTYLLSAKRSGTKLLLPTGLPPWASLFLSLACFHLPAAIKRNYYFILLNRNPPTPATGDTALNKTLAG